MGIYFEDNEFKLVFKDEFINENAFKGKISLFNIALRIRDFNDGHVGNITKHKDSPSIKVEDFGPGKAARHSKGGDPIYFWLDDNNHLELSYDNRKFKSGEINYIYNFIDHNFYHLSNYWFAPKFIKNTSNCLKYQKVLEERIKSNFKSFDYKKNQGVRDNEIKYF